MKRFFVFVMLLLPVMVMGQDNIMLKNGSNIDCTIKQINDSSIVIMKDGSNTAEVIPILKVYSYKKGNVVNTVNIEDHPYVKENDFDDYYKAYRQQMTTGMVCTAIGLAVAIPAQYYFKKPLLDDEDLIVKSNQYNDMVKTCTIAGTCIAIVGTIFELSAMNAHKRADKKLMLLIGKNGAGIAVKF